MCSSDLVSENSLYRTLREHIRIHDPTYVNILTDCRSPDSRTGIPSVSEHTQLEN